MAGSNLLVLSNFKSRISDSSRWKVTNYWFYLVFRLHFQIHVVLDIR
jgi:hypothetical protein